MRLWYPALFHLRALWFPLGVSANSYWLAKQGQNAGVLHTWVRGNLCLNQVCVSVCAWRSWPTMQMVHPVIRCASPSLMAIKAVLSPSTPSEERSRWLGSSIERRYKTLRCLSSRCIDSLLLKPNDGIVFCLFCRPQVTRWLCWPLTTEARLDPAALRSM